MKLVSALALAALAGVASANIVAIPAPLDSEPGYIGRAVVYSAIPGPYVGFPAAGGSLGFDAFTDEERAKWQPVPQRLVRRHPVTGRLSLFLSAHAGAIRGWPR